MLERPSSQSNATTREILDLGLDRGWMGDAFRAEQPRSPPRSLEAAVKELCNRFIDMLAFGAVIPDGQLIRMRGLPAWKHRHAGELDDPDFNNVHVEIGPDR